MEKEKCKCGELAVWYYMPASELRTVRGYCDNHVPRGCTHCNYRYVDYEGRFSPCDEYWYDEDGYDVQPEINQL